MKKAIFIPIDNGNSYKLIIKNNRKDDWCNFSNKILSDYQLSAVKKELKNDGYKIEVKTSVET